MAGHDIIVIGGSAGGIEALTALVDGLPPELPAALFIVIHTSPYGESALPAILQRAGPLPAAQAVQGEPIVPGRIYVARPDCHLILTPNGVSLSGGARENGTRPAINPLFRSAARAFGSRVIGVLLSGMLDDGTIGMMSIKRHGGITVCQDPEEALCPSIPQSAIASVGVDHICPMGDMAPLLTRLVAEHAGAVRSEENRMASEIERADSIIAETMAAQEHGQRHGEPSTYTCPACGGVVWQLNENGISQFQCHVGHAYSLQHLLVHHAEALENALWQAIRLMQQKAVMARQVQMRREPMAPDLRQRFQDQAEAAEANVGLLRSLVESPLFSSEQEALNAERLSETETNVS